MIFDKFDEEIVIIEQLIWHLGNILTSEKLVQVVIDKNLFDRVYDLLNRQKINEKIVKISTWFIANILKFKMFEKKEVIEKCVYMLVLFIKTDDEELINECMWGLSHATETEDKKLIEYMIKERLCEYIYSLNIGARENLILPAIRITGNLCSNETTMVDRLIEQGSLKFLEQFVIHKNNQTRKEALWAFSNIAGNDSQITQIFKTNLIPKIFHLVKDNDYEVTKEAIWAIGNLINSSNFENCVKLIDANVLDPILYLLSNFMDSYTVILTLNTIEILFEHGKYSSYVHEFNPFVKLFVEKGGLEAIDQLQYHKNEKIFAMVSNLIDNYFSNYIENKDNNN